MSVSPKTCMDAPDFLTAAAQEVVPAYLKLNHLGRRMKRCAPSPATSQKKPYGIHIRIEAKKAAVDRLQAPALTAKKKSARSTKSAPFRC